MDKAIISLFLPDGMLDYFEVTSVEKTEESYTISLAEKNQHPEEYAGENLISKGYFAEITVKDFPIRGKACYLKVKRRRWWNEDTGKVVFRNWELVAQGTRMTMEFASFLKALHRYHTGKL
ncbi:hypothetical protein OKW21_005744 [Catalinimonas alkaloidigena]|uniref:ISAon1 family transposase N-terminal region protein n=1 Tax=Catalinimonas alkaloidigena TaxID=1075417 RepID=UPI00240535DF|nr:transposase [Catalinimonas alkaloidigena]MDF9794744.1 hypothetical protein [Catalinimonas alkaloidigena]MDF9795664.1 hypothetical protein [Catalinimonas alkaloidigena]MDF9797759.1 hypothetical protein [Catalinimonas alkaloidigena]MDF9798337.1 hypothetical protein [Catalinimonas alkaloidigena]MDF9798374.1 hypothetical protein [Catalinimonas alkaloidigena]